MFAGSREKRPLLPKDKCPFCPGSGKVPENYDVYLYPNDFPIMRLDPAVVSENLQYKNKLYKTAKSYGVCEVVLYSPDHTGKIYDLSKEHIGKLIDLWTERFLRLSKEEKIKYVMIFENRGEVVGVTIHHPHGQIYGYSFMPEKVQAELNNTKKHFSENKSCMFCDTIEAEKKIGERTVYENDSFFAFVPFWAEYPYQVFIYSKAHKQTLTEFSVKEKEDLGNVLQTVVRMYDKIFDNEFPYMMCFHQSPVDGGNYDYYHFHIEFYPPMRNKLTQKFNASSETGAWVHGNPSVPEEKAREMREILRSL